MLSTTSGSRVLSVMAPLLGSVPTSVRRAGDGGSAVPAGAEDLQGVADLGVAVRRGDRAGPLLHRRTLDLHGRAAGAADQVVVVGGAAPAVDALAGLGAQRVDLAGVGEGLQGPVDRRQTDLLAALAEQGVDVLGAAEVVEGLQRRGDRPPLPGRPARTPVSVLVIVLPVDRVAVAVVDVVDVVAVGSTATWPQAGPWSWGCWSVSSWSGGSTSRKGARSRARWRSHAPIGQVATKPASESSTIVGPGRDGGPLGGERRDHQAAHRGGGAEQPSRRPASCGTSG